MAILPSILEALVIFSYPVFSEAVMTVTDVIMEYKLEPSVHVHKYIVF